MFDELKLSVAAAHMRLCRAVKLSASDGSGGSAGGGCGGRGGEPWPSSSSLIKPQLRSHRFASGYTGNVAVESAASLTLALQNVTGRDGCRKSLKSGVNEKKKVLKIPSRGVLLHRRGKKKQQKTITCRFFFCCFF